MYFIKKTHIFGRPSRADRDQIIRGGKWGLINFLPLKVEELIRGRRLIGEGSLLEDLQQYIGCKAVRSIVNTMTVNLFQHLTYAP